MTRGPNLAEVKALLQERVVDLCQELLPTGTHYPMRGYWLAKNPHRDDKRPSLVVQTTKREPGAWKDWGAEQFRGDVVKLIEFVERLPDTREALRWARNWLGIEHADPDSFKRVAAIAVAKRQRKAEDDAKRLFKDRRRALGVWLDARKGAQPEAQSYFSARGLDLGLLPKWPGAVRFAPAMPYSQLAVRDARGAILRPPPEFPAIVTMLTDALNVNGAIHRIYLNADCSDKADLGRDAKGHPWPQRLCWPSYGGFVGRIWNGAGDMPIAEAIKHGVVTDLAVGEGVEDAIAIAIGDPDWRVWAAISLANLAHLYIELPCIGDVLIWRDNDWDKPEAIKQFDAAMAALKARAPGKRIEAVRAPGTRGGPKDANDLIRR